MSGSTEDRTRRSEDSLSERLDVVGRRLGRALFGDRRGAALFLGALCFFALFWRIETLSNDNYANLNALVHLAEGRLHVADPTFGPASGETPGMRYVDGRRVGDNYGLVVLSLPALLALRAAALVVDLRVALVAVWCFALLALAFLVGDVTGRERAARTAGAVVAGVAFVANLAVATPFPSRWLPLVALQSTTAVAAALTAVLCYRLGCRLSGGDRRVGLAAGVATAAATPVGFWAVGPKQHAVTALLVTAALYALYRSRTAPSVRGETAFRAAAYACVGLTAWQHSGEALLLGLALVPVDLATARRNGPVQLGVVAGAVALSALPFLVTNAVVAGDPLQPLKLLPSYRGQELVGVDPGPAADVGSTGGDGAVDAGGTAGDGESTAESGGSADDDAGGTTGGGETAPESGGSADGDAGGTTGDGGSGVLAAAADQVARLAALLSAVAGLFDRGLSAVVSRAERSLSAFADLHRVRLVFLRSGYASVYSEKDAAINLSVLESMPLIGALTLLPAAALRRLANARRATASPVRVVTSPAAVVRRLRRPERATDAFAALYAALLLVVVFHRLPVQHMLTVRYLHALYPLSVYALLRSEIVRETVSTAARRLTVTYVAAVLVGLALYAAALALLHLSLGEAVQLYGTVACGVGLVAATWGFLVAASERIETRRSVGATALAVAGATATVYLLVAAGLFSTTGRFLLPLSRTVVRALFYVP